MESFDFYFRIKRYSISINPKFICIEKWDNSYFDNESIFRYDFPKNKPKTKPKPNPESKPESKPIETTDDDDFDPIPF